MSGLCLFILRLILNRKSITIVGPEGEQSNDKHDKNVKVIKSWSEHGQEYKKSLEIIRKGKIKVVLV